MVYERCLERQWEYRHVNLACKFSNDELFNENEDATVIDHYASLYVLYVS